MKSFCKLAVLLLAALTVALSACTVSAPETGGTDGDDPIAPTPVQAPPEPEPEPEPAPSPAYALQDMVDQTNDQLRGMADQLAGIFNVYAEARGTGSLVVVFRAEDELYEDLEICMELADEMAAVYSTLPPLMLAVDIPDPRVIVEFLDMGGGLIYSREFTLDSVPDVVQPPVGVDSEEALLSFVETQQATAAQMEQEMLGYATVEIEARGSNTLAYVFHIREYSASAGITEDAIRTEVLPMFESMYAPIVPMLASIGIADPVVIIEFYAPDGSLLDSAEIR